MSLRIKANETTGGYDIVDAYGNVIQEDIADLNKARAIAATRNAVKDETPPGSPEKPDDE